MSTATQAIVSQRELAQRWGRSETAIALASAVGAGPRWLRLNGQVVYPLSEVQRYERACLFFDPADVAFKR